MARLNCIFRSLVGAALLSGIVMEASAQSYCCYATNKRVGVVQTSGSSSGVVLWTSGDGSAFSPTCGAVLWADTTESTEAARRAMLAMLLMAKATDKEVTVFWKEVNNACFMTHLQLQ
jgi:hypothetical protein